MKAAFITGVRKLEIREVPDPVLEDPSHVLVRMESVGVCGSDALYFASGLAGGDPLPYPFIPGHELTATVTRVGADAGNFPPGQRVAIDPLIRCGRCDQCLAGRENTCRNQVFLGYPGQAPGGLRQFMVLPARNCIPLPDGLGPEAILVEPLSIGLHACRLAAGMEGRSCAVLGAGPIGLSVLLSLRAAGAGALFATDLKAERRAAASRLGARWTGSPEDADVVGAILSREAAGVDVVFECAGEQETLDQAVMLLKPGGVLMIIGIPEAPFIRFRPDLLRRKEIRIQNVRRQNRCMEDAVELAVSNARDLASLLTHLFPLEAAQEAFALAVDYRDGVIKAAVGPWL